MVNGRVASIHLSISFDPESSLVEIKRVVNGRPTVKYVPLSNVASFEPAPVEEKSEVKKK